MQWTSCGCAGQRSWALLLLVSALCPRVPALLARTHASHRPPPPPPPPSLPSALPHVGYVTIILQDYPVLKVLMVGLMALFVLTGKET